MTHLKLITTFPDARDARFTWDSHNDQFRHSNVIINARSSDVSYGEHWGPLSIKCAFGGNEYYRLNNCTYAVNDGSYLVVNAGNYRSSYIFSKAKVESFTISFCSSFVGNCLAGELRDNDSNLANPFGGERPGEFHERLYRFDSKIGGLLYQLKAVLSDLEENSQLIDEYLRMLVAGMIERQRETNAEASSVEAVRPATRMELFRRLTRAKDFIDSCYNMDLTLADIAKVSFLNETYLLRQFRKFYRVTPRQYQIQKRMAAAKSSLQFAGGTITELCREVGYSDLASFSKLFKRLYGCSPELYRARACGFERADRA
jgi:AraC-like DNA-binding protein